MKLLIITQKVNIDDSILGFFHRWIIEFAKHCESVLVICLEKGRYEFPTNVRVLSLGKEEGVTRLKYLNRLYHYIWKERKNYDAVFVHMNPIYVVLCGFLWKIFGKNISLWYTHKNVDWRLKIAEKLVDNIFTASKESFRLKSKKIKIFGHGIDTNFFSPDTNINPHNSLLSVGRLMPSKRHDIAIEVAAYMNRKIKIVGDGIERENLTKLSHKLGADVEFLGSLGQEKLRDEYRKSSVLIHTSETGSLDKVVLEALACGLRVVSTSTALSDLPITRVSLDIPNISQGIHNSELQNKQELVSYVKEKHSLQNLIPNILKSIEKHGR